jgi:hypothetical protein
MQFTEAAWLQAMWAFGADVGNANYASAIKRDKEGALSVQPSSLKDTILGMREDPVLSARLAAANLRRARTLVKQNFARAATRTDLYMFHALGPTGALRFLTALAKTPRRSAVLVVEEGALRNAGLVGRDGQVLSVARTYAGLKQMLDRQKVQFATMPVKDAQVMDPTGVRLVAVN